MNAEAVALVTCAASIVGTLVGQLIAIYFQGRLNQLERTRMTVERSGQLYAREIAAYDAIVPGLAGLLYICRELVRDEDLRKPRQADLEDRYVEIQSQVRTAVQSHLVAAGHHYHVLRSEAMNRIDQEARALFRLIDEVTAPVSGGEPISETRAEAIWDELESMRVRVLQFCTEELDVSKLEGSFHRISEPIERDLSRGPRILGERLRT